MNKLSKSLKLLYVLFVSFISLLPYAIICLSSLNSSVNVRKGNIISGISLLNLYDNLKTVFSDTGFITAIKNSLIISVFSVILCLFISSIAGYSYCVFQNKLTKKFFLFTVLAIMIPSSAILIPSFIMLKNCGLLDNIFSIILTSMPIPLIVYLFRQSTKMFPFELIKSARIDGLNEIQIFIEVFCPNMIPTFITSAVLVFFETWNGYIYPLIIVQSQKNTVVSLFINSYGTSYTTDYGAFMLILLLSMLPTILVFIFTRKYFLNGMFYTIDS